MLYRCMDSFKNYMVGFGKAAVVYVADIDSRGVGIGVAESTWDDGEVYIAVVGYAGPGMTYDIGGYLAIQMS